MVRDFGDWDERRDDALLHLLAAFAGSIQLLEIDRVYSRSEEVFYARVTDELTFPALQQLVLSDPWLKDISFLRKAKGLFNLKFLFCRDLRNI